MKTQRHNAIQELLLKTTASNRAVTNQEDLRLQLAKRGIHVTQATLSRDIRELKLMKGPNGYELPADENNDDPPQIAEVLRGFGLEVRQAQNLLVLLTTLGGAAPVAASLDQEEYDEVVGTIAGDNTVLVICPDARRAEVVRTRIEAYLA